MTLTATQWPFLAPEQRTPEQNERWWRECYLPSPADVTVRGVPHSVVAAGKPGSGKTTLLQAFEKAEAEQFLMVRYPIARWPGERHAWVKEAGHLGQIMACASMAVKNILAHQPDELSELSDTNLEYLRWLIEKYSGARAFKRWADAIQHQPLLDSLDQPFDDLYPTDTELLDVQGQIEELVTLSQRLGFEGGVAVLVDVNDTDAITKIVLEKVKGLFGWLTPLQFEGFAIKAALPETVVEQARLLTLSRGRVTFTTLDWPSELCQELSSRHLQAATDQQRTDLTEIASIELLTALEEKTRPLYGGPSPQAWIWLTKTLLDGYAKQNEQLGLEHRGGVIRAYFANYAPLRFDRNRQGVWCGGQFIHLDDQPFSFFEVLWHNRNRGDANQALFSIAGSQGNLNTIASRLRKTIEPVPKRPIYLHNTRSQGYWLENVVGVDV